MFKNRLENTGKTLAFKAAASLHQLIILEVQCIQCWHTERTRSHAVARI